MAEQYQEYSLAKIKKENAEFLTPKVIIDLIHNDIEDRWQDRTVIDVACGSGGLSYNLKCQKVYGVEINPDAATIAAKNGLDVWTGDYFDYPNPVEYDCVISNPPFSLKRQDKHIPIYNKYGTKGGVLDPYFVLESFNRATFEGYYVLFCGLLYRQQERWFRKFLIDNNYLDKIWITKPNLFAETSIAVVILKLKKNRDKTTVECFNPDNYQSIIDISEFVKNEYSITIPDPPKIEEKIDINEINKQVENEFKKHCENHYKMNEAVKECEKLLQELINEGILKDDSK